MSASRVTAPTVSLPAHTTTSGVRVRGHLVNSSVYAACRVLPVPNTPRRTAQILHRFVGGDTGSGAGLHPGGWCRTCSIWTARVVACVRPSSNRRCFACSRPTWGRPRSRRITPSTSTRRSSLAENRPETRKGRPADPYDDDPEGHRADWRGEDELLRAEDQQSDDGHENHQIDEPAVAGEEPADSCGRPERPQLSERSHHLSPHYQPLRRCPRLRLGLGEGVQGRERFLARW